MDSFDFDQINLVPRLCQVNSRSECDTSIVLKKGDFSIRYELPIIPANMECVIDTDLAIKLARAGLAYSYHRFGLTTDFVQKMAAEKLPISISVGVNEDSMELIHLLNETFDITPDT